MLDESRLDELSRLAAGVTTRRLALGVAAAVGGLALGGDVTAARDDVNAERRRRGRRGRRGRQGPEGPNGPSGPTGPDGPPAGSSVVVVTEPCSFPDSDPAPGAGVTDACVASCPSGYIATGGGYDGPTFLNALGYVRSSYPVLNGADLPVGWTTVMEFIQTPWTFDVTTYVICVPE